MKRLLVALLLFASAASAQVTTNPSVTGVPANLQTLGLSPAITGIPVGSGASYSAYAGTSCTNQFPRSLNASGVATCASVAAATDVSGTLPIANGGTNRTIKPAFHAVRSSNLVNVTGNGDVYPTIIFDTKVFDSETNYDTTTGLFTAPVTGIYRFSWLITLTDLDSTHALGNGGGFLITAGGVDYQAWYGNPAVIRDASGYVVLNGTILLTLTAADTVKIGGLYVTSGSKSVDVYGQAAAGGLRSSFHGELVR